MLLSESAKINERRVLPLSRLTPALESTETRTSRLQSIYRRKLEFSQRPYYKSSNPNKFVESFHLNLYDAEVHSTAEPLAELFGVHDADPEEYDPSIAHEFLLPTLEAKWDQILCRNRLKSLDKTGLCAVAVVAEEVLKDVLSSYKARMREIPESQWSDYSHPLLRLSENEAEDGGYAYTEHLRNFFTSAAENEKYRLPLVKEIIRHISLLFGGEAGAIEDMVKNSFNDYLRRERISVVGRFHRLSLSENGLKKKRKVNPSRLAIGFSRRKNFIGCPKFIRDIRKHKWTPTS